MNFLRRLRELWKAWTEGWEPRNGREHDEEMLFRMEQELDIPMHLRFHNRGR